MNLKNKTIAFLGAGNMAEALIRGLLAAKIVPAAQIIAHDIRTDRLEELRKTFGIRTGKPEADIIILAVKPQQMNAALSDIKPAGLFISIAAGITTAQIEKELGGRPRVIRAMPNTPALVGAGAAAIAAGKFALLDDLASAETILQAVGTVVRVEEKDLDAVTALSGSGPAYIFLVAEALIAAGIAEGLAPVIAQRLAFQTVLGAALLLREGKDGPAELRRKVTSPGGTTEAAVAVLLAQKLPEIFVEAVTAAAKRSRQLAGQ